MRITKIRLRYRFKVPTGSREKVDRVLASYAEKCPAYQSVKGCIECSWERDVDGGDAEGVPGVSSHAGRHDWLLGCAGATPPDAGRRLGRRPGAHQDRGVLRDDSRPGILGPAQ